MINRIDRLNGYLNARHGKVLSAAFADEIQIATMGPLGHVYLPGSFSDPTEGTAASPDLEKLALALNRRARIPIVLFKRDKEVFAVNSSGTFALMENRELILGKDHPFLDQAAEDLKALCLHPDAGDLVISGWRPEGTPLSFNMESGSHGGPGREETRGFVLLPPCMNNDQPWLRPLDLRNHIFAYVAQMKKESGPCRTS